MRVLINQLTAIRQRTGIGHYVAELLQGLCAQNTGDEFLTYPPPWVERGLGAWKRFRKKSGGPGKMAPGGQLSGSLKRWLNTAARTVTAWHFRAAWAGREFDLYHEPNYIPLPCERPTIATIPDLSVLLHPQWHPADRVAHFDKHFHPGLARCCHFLAISEFARQEMIQTLGLAPERVTNVYLGIRRGMHPLPECKVAPVLHRLGLPPSYLLYVGTLEPRKNILMLLRVYCSLPAEVRSRCPLLLVGGWGWNTAELAEYFHNEARHLGVLHVGYLPESDLNAVYNGALTLAFPTFYEGLGLPPLEMMACGGAVLGSTAGALVETIGSRAHLLDPHDADAWRAALLRLVQDDDWRQVLRTGVAEIASPFTWERCAAQTLQVYRTVAGVSAYTTTSQAA